MSVKTKEVPTSFTKLLLFFLTGVKTHFFDMLKYDNLFSMLSQGAVFQKKKKVKDGEKPVSVTVTQEETHQKQYSGCCTWDVQAYTGLRVNRALSLVLGTLSQ